MAKRTGTFDVFVGNLPTDANEKNVGKIFSKYGEIQGIIVKEPNNNPLLKYAFVKYLCEPDADKACTELNGQEVQGKRVIVRRQEQHRKGKPMGLGKESSNQQQRTGGRIGKSSQPDIVPEGADTDSNAGSTGGGSYSEKESVMVTFVENCVTVWVQVVNEENTNKLMKITDQLAALCPAAAKVSGQPQQLKIYAAQFSEDNMWYRCSVKQFIGTEKVKVQYVDYGNSEEISINSLVEIPQNLAATRPLATKFILHNTKANKFNDVNGMSLLRKLTEGKVIQAVRTRNLADGIGHYALIYLDGQSINDTMIEEGYATKRPPQTSKGPTDTESTGSGSQLFGSGDPLTGTSSLRFNRFAGGDAGPFGLGGGGYASESTGSVTSHPFMQGRQIPPSSSTGNEEALRSELSKKKREVDKLRGEVAKRDLQLQQLTANKVQLQSVVDLADKVKELRVQFPTGRSSGLEEAIALALSDEKVQNSSVHSLQSVMSTMSTYKAAQKEIICSSNHEELANLIMERDGARRDLHGKLQECIDELLMMPLDTRYKTLKDMENKLIRDYKIFLGYNVHGCPLLEDLAFGFRDWKSRKEGEFRLVRENSNVCQQNMMAFLHRLSGLMSLDVSTEDMNCVVDQDSLLRSYSQALQQELVITDLEHSSDASMVATILAAILKELRGEMKTLENLKAVVNDFTHLKSSIQPWLEVRPNLESITERRKAIRGLKSKLRHKEADRQDLEESGDGTTEEMADIHLEMANLKSQLHKQLLCMDDLLASLAVNADEHFPELSIQHQDLGIDIQLGYGGLVKLGRDIEHYTLQQDLRMGMYSSVFADKPVYLQELHINDEDRVGKEEFIQNIIAYADMTRNSEFLLNVEGVFFSKNDRVAYIQMERTELQLLPDLMKIGTVADKVKQSVFEGVTEALVDLHSKGFVHGEVNPSNVGVKPDGSSVLLPPDFSRPVLERVKKRHVTENGICFLPIEMINYSQQGLAPQVALSCDMYNHGLLLLWLHNHQGLVELQHDGAPKLANIGLDPYVMELLYSQLFPVCEKRLPIKQLLKCRYLTQVIAEPMTVVPDCTPSLGPRFEGGSEFSEEAGAEERNDEVPSAETVAQEHHTEDTMANIGVFDFNALAKPAGDVKLTEQDSECCDAIAVDQLAQDLASINMPAFQGDLAALGSDIGLCGVQDMTSCVVNGDIAGGAMAAAEIDDVACDQKPAMDSQIDYTNVIPAAQNEAEYTNVTPAAQNEAEYTNVTPAAQNEADYTNVIPAAQNEADYTNVTPAAQNEADYTNVTPAAQNEVVQQPVSPKAATSSDAVIPDLELMTSLSSQHSFLRQETRSRSPLQRLLRAAAESKETL